MTLFLWWRRTDNAVSRKREPLGVFPRVANNTRARELTVLIRSIHEKSSANMHCFFRGGDERIRTVGLCVANASLYQLSHAPITQLL